MSVRGYIIAASVVALVASNGISLMRGKAWGERVADDRHAAAVEALEAELKHVTEKTAATEAIRLQIERERNDLLEELDRAGDAAVGAGRVAIPADSVRRIDSIGRAD